MNAIFPLMVYHSNDGSKVQSGQSAGVGLFKPCSSTAVYPSKASIKAAKDDIGTWFPDSLLPRLDQLRSIRQGFHHMSAYFSALAEYVGMMPPTVFTLGGHDTTNNQKMEVKNLELFENQHELPIIDNEELGERGSAARP
ncbi:MAG: hypothetical protein J3Q66DRAFT_365378 [Benniella sp.]|nr:MAG: hypothetical protein J3Q66DRAFT_365378 [Benniella sp.]